MTRQTLGIIICMFCVLVSGVAAQENCDYEETITVIDELVIEPTEQDIPEFQKVLVTEQSCQDGITFATVHDFVVRECTNRACGVTQRTHEEQTHLVCGEDVVDTIHDQVVRSRIPWYKETVLPYRDVLGPVVEKGVTKTLNNFSITFQQSTRAAVTHGWTQTIPGYEVIGTPVTIHVEKPVDVRVDTDAFDEYFVVQQNTTLVNPQSVRIHDSATVIPVEKCSLCSAYGLWEINTHTDADTSVVLVHGLLTDPGTFGELIKQFTQRGWPWNIYVLRYDYNENVNISASTLIRELDRLTGSYNRLVLVGHSFGSIVVQSALEQAQQDTTHAFLDRLEGVVLAAGPNKGTPVFDVYQDIKNNAWTEKVAVKFLNTDIDEENMYILRNGRTYPTVPDVPYVAIAGTQSYQFSLAQKLTSPLKGPNDGVVTVESAQHVGELVLDTPCVNFFTINLTHTELLEHPLSLRMIEMVISKLLQNTPRYQPIHTIELERCSPYKSYAVLAVNVTHDSETQVCACGDGVCGTGETAEICPDDCARVTTAGPLCFALTPMILIGFILLILSTLTHTFIRYRSRGRTTHITHISRFVLGALVFLMIMLLAGGSVQCVRNVMAEAFVLGALIAFVITVELIMQRE